jgi:predicted NUDIX family NTP pyrophosphohydrolase
MARRFPESDRAEWFALDFARDEINKGKAPLSIARNKSPGRCH